MDNNIFKRSVPIVTIALIAINVIVFIVMEMLGSTEDAGFMLAHGATSYDKIVRGKEYYRIITSFFMHFGTEHLINNMFVLAVIGYYIESVIGKARFFITYMLSGIIANIASLIWNYYTAASDIVGAGASGAVFGMSGALICIIIKHRKDFEEFPYVNVIMFIVLTIYAGYNDPSIDNAAHAAGFFSGAAIIYLLTKFRRNNHEAYGQ